jgi:hypothetical protein
MGVGKRGKKRSGKRAVKLPRGSMPPPARVHPDLRKEESRKACRRRVRPGAAEE